jgi:3-oxoacyl-[acyl-carrier protein] reductase
MDKTIMITGSSRGLGAQIAKEACKKGYYYYGISRFNDLDVVNYDDIKDYILGFYDVYYDENPNGRPVALINNAGICVPENIFELNIENFIETFRINLFGLVNCCNLYAKLCKDFSIKGKIINIASTAGLGARPGRSAYAASKAAVINFSLSLTEELRPYGLKVYCVAPGAFESDMRREIAPDDDFKKMLKPDKVARFILSLIEDGELLDGQIIKIIK